MTSDLKVGVVGLGVGSRHIRCFNHHPQCRVTKICDLDPTVASRVQQEYPDTDCVFCVSDAPAFGLLSAAKSAGLRIPEDLAIAGFGNFEVSRFASPTISTVVVDPRRIGRQTGQLIGQLLGSDPSDSVAKKIDVEPVPVMRESTKHLI